MKQARLEKLFTEHKTDKLSWTGSCHDCKKETTVMADWTEECIKIEGGAIYEADEKIFLKCTKCYAEDPVLRNFRVTQQYSRCVGYMRPVQDWNKGKQAEYAMRKPFKIPSRKVLEQADLTV